MFAIIQVEMLIIISVSSLRDCINETCIFVCLFIIEQRRQQHHQHQQKKKHNYVGDVVVLFEFVYLFRRTK